MQIDWLDLGTAFALYLVIEGILPFVNPGGMKRAMALFHSLPDRQLRMVGFGSMLAGLVLLWAVRG